MLERQYRKDANRHASASPFLIHFRIASHGSICYENCHPFMMDDGGAMIHNGMLPFSADRTKSDTKEFAENIVKVMGENWQDNEYAVGLVEEAIGKHNKIVMLWPDYSYLILNEKSGFWREDVWFSNYSCNRRAPVVTRNPTTPATATGSSHNVTPPATYSPRTNSPVQTRPYIDDGLYAPGKVWDSARLRWCMPPQLVEGESLRLVEPPRANREGVVWDEELKVYRDAPRAPEKIITPADIVEAEEARIEAREKRINDAILEAKGNPPTPPSATYDQISNMIKANERFMNRMKNGAELINVSGKLRCSRCRSDVTAIEVRLDHTSDECDEIARFMRPMSADEGRVINGTHGRHIVAYPGL